MYTYSTSACGERVRDFGGHPGGGGGGGNNKENFSCQGLLEVIWATRVPRWPLVRVGVIGSQGGQGRRGGGTGEGAPTNEQRWGCGSR